MGLSCLIAILLEACEQLHDCGDFLVRLGVLLFVVKRIQNRDAIAEILCEDLDGERAELLGLDRQVVLGLIGGLYPFIGGDGQEAAKYANDNDNQTGDLDLASGFRAHRLLFCFPIWYRILLGRRYGTSCGIVATI